MDTRNTLPSKNKKQIVVFAGTNGAGKTTTYYLGKKHIPLLSSIPYINPDEIAVSYGIGQVAAGKMAILERNERLKKVNHSSLKLRFLVNLKNFY